jgi:hypothetical protein
MYQKNRIVCCQSCQAWTTRTTKARTTCPGLLSSFFKKEDKSPGTDYHSSGFHNPYSDDGDSLLDDKKKTPKMIEECIDLLINLKSADGPLTGKTKDKPTDKPIDKRKPKSRRKQSSLPMQAPLSPEVEKTTKPKRRTSPRRAEDWQKKHNWPERRPWRDRHQWPRRHTPG